MEIGKQDEQLSLPEESQNSPAEAAEKILTKKRDKRYFPTHTPDEHDNPRHFHGLNETKKI